MFFLFGLDETGKKLKKAFKATGADMAIVRPWLKSYIQVRHQMRPVTAHYQKVRSLAEQLEVTGKRIEQLLVEHRDCEMNETARSEMKGLLVQLAAARPQLDCEFVISKADKDIHMTLEGLERIGADYLEGKGDILILQSEVENLNALVQENLQREKPDLFWLTCYYLNHTDQEFADMSYSSRILYIDEIFHKEFAQPILGELEKALKAAKDYEKNPKIRKEAVEILLKDPDAGAGAQYKQDSPGAQTMAGQAADFNRAEKNVQAADFNRAEKNVQAADFNRAEKTGLGALESRLLGETMKEKKQQMTEAEKYLRMLCLMDFE